MAPRPSTPPARAAPPEPTHAPPATPHPAASVDPEHALPAHAAAPAADLPWNPAHPCFPHANPHVPAGSPLARATRVIRVPRDWTAGADGGDAVPAFGPTYPEILRPWVREQDFRQLLADLNGALEHALRPGGARAWLDAALGLATGWLSEDLGLHGAKGGMKRVEAVVAAWNAARRREHLMVVASGGAARDEGDKEVAVYCVDPRRTAYLSLDFVIPDPKISVGTRPGTRPLTREGDGDGAAEDGGAREERGKSTQSEEEDEARRESAAREGGMSRITQGERKGSGTRRAELER